MSDLTLVIGNKNYSSWSLRPWLALRHVGVPFAEVRIPLYLPDSSERLRAWSPSGLVPLLVDGDLRVWDSLAICEHLAERFPAAGLWPAERQARAWARSISAEMHAGFTALRQAMPMNINRRCPGLGRTPECLADIRRITAIWEECRDAHAGQGDFLFGPFGIADAMYAPVVLRFETYGWPLEGAARDYAAAVRALPALADWVRAAQAEEERIAAFDRCE